ncbi:hypothetical protein MKUB_13020 [Mycobacterium kubicae]|uniref:NurA domain-containing protein n=1 Tax=Mycobacterium kubicae TaxID=120959 RepID=A0AAX1JCI3_9MYCO|nr:hypothetical protein [Mycobacterium kubicae]MCV7096675.1 hypothetical protein [Mycobacterium kubicae]ORW04236.1 hypothetical protein AWC13_00705 [Mycobacterium kubicae]QNI11048.1 hypothetical protein GAN18_07355 [Mycobacterium kubicae]QPI39260.1 hypothetical protein I2456_07225 [Mycobacterium kubicae]GFG63812.1 hypothetical protein MKUB_13020 [Mycobacterium kubicae]
MRFSVDGWDPSYGTAIDIQELAETSSKVDATPEVGGSGWAPIAPDTATPVPQSVLFVDGVRRIDARAWIDDLDAPNGEGNRAVPGLCASYAAGVVRASAAGADVIASEVRRGLFSEAATAETIDAGFEPYVFHRTVSDEEAPPGASLTNALQRVLADLELTVAVEARNRPGPNPSEENDLLVVDGPLRGKAHLSRALGYVKTHGVQYLPPGLNAVVSELRTADRSPIFVIASGWDRYSWYLRLPCLPGSPWAGIVRLEAAADRSLKDVIATANMTQVLFPRFASVEYKEPRAPQNLVPIAGLEKWLRHQLGDATLLYRSLRMAAHKLGTTE